MARVIPETKETDRLTILKEKEGETTKKLKELQDEINKLNNTLRETQNEIKSIIVKTEGKHKFFVKNLHRSENIQKTFAEIGRVVESEKEIGKTFGKTKYIGYIVFSEPIVLTKDICEKFSFYEIQYFDQAIWNSSIEPTDFDEYMMFRYGETKYNNANAIISKSLPVVVLPKKKSSNLSHKYYSDADIEAEDFQCVTCDVCGYSIYYRCEDDYDSYGKFYRFGDWIVCDEEVHPNCIEIFMKRFRKQGVPIPNRICATNTVIYL
ncbi:MAG: hypothetical protein Edafosvirus1_55 [Edafosvirus sp.]|uniref:Uncharacterized protein n=1 Tax=Edafosvirus sp. TaxID=2487765 RepID=A0A3G4ZTR8_9VIRU|nr:MAG: hypothetical protein Edafosvirus1_55 [Edafosvirus sp.]